MALDSLVETAKANGIEPYEYLPLVLTMLPYLGKSPSPCGTGKTDALASGNEAPGAYTEVNDERQSPVTGFCRLSFGACGY